MTVLHLDTGLTWRGGQQQVYLLHRGLLQRGVRSRLLARGELLGRCREEGLEVSPLRGRMVWDPRALARVLEAAGRLPEKLLVHAHDGRAHALGVVVRATRPDTQLVCHRRVSYPLPGNAVSRWKRRRVDAWIAVSRAVADVLQTSAVPMDRVSVVHSAIEARELQGEVAAADLAALRDSLAIPAAAPVIGCAGAFTQQKGHAVLIDAAGAVLRAVPDAIFVLAGEGTLLPAMRRRVEELGMTAAFRFPGFRRDVAAITALLTVAVVPSVAGEGSAAAIKEPMALRVPVVVSDLPGNLEVLDGAGISVSAGSADGLAAQLVRLLRNPGLRMELARAGCDRISAFTPDAMVDATLSVYRELQQ
jgi:glycosyltransferase involved in cell wall biosynthesis